MMTGLPNQLPRLPLWLRIVLGAQAGLVVGFFLGYGTLFEGHPATWLRTFWGLVLAGSAAGAGLAYFDYRLRVRAGRAYSPRQLALSASLAVGTAGALALALVGIGSERLVTGWALTVGAGVFAATTYWERRRWNSLPPPRTPKAVVDGVPQDWPGDVRSLLAEAGTVTLFVPYTGTIDVGDLELIGSDRWSGTVVVAGPGSTKSLLGKRVRFLERHVYRATLRSGTWSEET